MLLVCLLALMPHSASAWSSMEVRGDEFGYGDAASWTNTVSGDWADSYNWNGSRIPGPGTNVSINADGTYTVTYDSSVSSAEAANISVGTVSSSGTQTLDINNYAITASNITIGARGALQNNWNGQIQGAGTMTLQDGAVWTKTGSGGGSINDRHLTVEGGATWTIPSGAKYTAGQPGTRDLTNTIDGVLSGDGTLEINEQSQRIVWTGTGSLDVASIALNNNNGYLYLGGSLTVNSPIDHGATANNRSYFMDGANVTLNGTYSVPSGNPRVFMVEDSSATATVGGTNSITIRSSTPGTTRFTGGGDDDNGGTITIGGTGSLTLENASSGVIKTRADTLNIQRDTTLVGTGSGGYMMIENGVINFSGSGNTFTMSTNSQLYLNAGQKTFTIDDGAEIKLAGAKIRGNSSGNNPKWNIKVGEDSAATLALTANTSNRLYRSGHATRDMYFLVSTNATVSAGSGSVLQLDNARIGVATTNGNNWGLKSAGTINIGSNSYFEALSTDRGTNAVISQQPFYLNELAFNLSGDSTLTLWNDGHLDNDQDATNDAALYVTTLDLSAVPGGNTLTLAGDGIASPKLYYQNISNPNSVTLSPSGDWLEVVPPVGGISCTITNVPVPTGAQWRLTTGSDTDWNDSGDTISVNFGSYTQEFKEVFYYVTPTSRVVSVPMGSTNDTTVGYATNTHWGTVSCAITPSGANGAGAQWRLTDSPDTNWHDSGESIEGLQTNSYDMTFKDGLIGWAPPADKAPLIPDSATTNVAAVYTPVTVYEYTIVSDYGQADPAVGTYSNNTGTSISCAVTNPTVTSGTTQHVSTGWSRTGSDAGSGTTTNTSFTLSADTVNTWLWETNFFLDTAVDYDGSVDMDNTWHRSYSNATITPTPDAGFDFWYWSGDVPGANTGDNPLVVLMDQPRSVTAHFTPAVGASWTNVAGGIWNDAYNWNNSAIPGPNTNVSINASGAYTSEYTSAGPVDEVAHLYVGTTSGSGTQTLQLNNYALTASNVVIGPRGAFLNNWNGRLEGQGDFEMRNGAVWTKTGGGGGDIGDHHLLVNAGATVSIGTGVQLPVYQPGTRNLTNVINGEITGAGDLYINEKDQSVFWTGTGTISVATISLNNNNGYLFLDDTLTISSTIDHSDGNANNRSIFMDGSDTTFNGAYWHNGNARVFFANESTDSFTVRGSGDITITNVNTTGFTGAHVGDNGGTATFAGTGDLRLYNTGAGTKRIQIRGTTINLQRDTFIGASDDVTDAYCKTENSSDINVSGSGTVLTIETNGVLRLDNENKHLNVNSNATFALSGGVFEGNANPTASAWNLRIGEGTAGTLTLAADTNSTFRRYSTGNPLFVLLDSYAVVSASVGSEMHLDNVRMGVAMTDGGNWGLKSAGSVVLDEDSYFEALSTDNGELVTATSQEFYLNELKVRSSDNLTLTLWNDGAADNDSDSTTDSALYVKTLDLSEMSGGTTLSLGTSEIGSPKLYYQSLTNPNSVSLDSNIIQGSLGGSIFRLR